MSDSDSQLFPHADRRDHSGAALLRAEASVNVCCNPGIRRDTACAPQSATTCWGVDRRVQGGQRHDQGRFHDKKAGWYAVLEDPQMPVTSTWLDQAHNTIERKLFAMKGFHHPSGSPQAFLTGLAHLYNLVPYQRRAQHAGQGGGEVEGGKVPTHDWLLNLQILTSGGFQCAPEMPYHVIRWNVQFSFFS